MILEQQVTVRIAPSNIKWYKQKGYSINHIGDTINVDVKDLMPSCKLKVKCVCDFCKKEFFRSYHIARHSKRHSCGNQDCKNLLRKETNLKLFGVEVASQDKTLAAKAGKTFKKNFGINSKNHDSYVKKRNETNIKNCGNKKGYEDTKEIQSKRMKSLYKNFDEATCKKEVRIPASKMQVKICECLNGILNKRIYKNYIADIVVGNIIIEYDGCGHKLFRKDNTNNALNLADLDLERDKKFVEFGWKVIHLIGSVDFDILKRTIEQCKKIFETKNVILVKDSVVSEGENL